MPEWVWLWDRELLRYVYWSWRHGCGERVAELSAERSSLDFWIGGFGACAGR